MGSIFYRQRHKLLFCFKLPQLLHIPQASLGGNRELIYPGIEKYLLCNAPVVVRYIRTDGSQIQDLWSPSKDSQQFRPPA